MGLRTWGDDSQSLDLVKKWIRARRWYCCVIEEQAALLVVGEWGVGAGLGLSRYIRVTARPLGILLQLWDLM